MSEAKRDANYTTTLLGVSINDLSTPELLSVDPGNNRLMVSSIVTGGLADSTTGIEADIDYRYGGGKSAYAATIAASGNTDAITPSAGNRIRVFWIAFVPNSDNSAANLVKLGFGTTGGAISTELYRGYALAHWEVFTGTADQSVIINTATAESVAVTIHYMEVS